jgi:uncharacterized membrane protein
MHGPFFMDAVITPHRSLSSRGFIILICVLTAINAASAVFFLMIGAGPVPIFLGLDLVAVIVAFAASNRAARNRERVQVTATEVRVVLESPRGERTVWLSPTAFTRVDAAAARDGAVRLLLSDRDVRVGAALSGPERAAFASALDRAIWRARSGQTLATPDR